jgi:hypothetical protein
MAAGPATILRPDDNGENRHKWQLLKSPATAVETAITAVKLCQAIQDVSFAQDTLEFLDVSRYRKIAVQFWAVASEDGTDVVNLYGWGSGGPGGRMAVMTLTHSTATSPAATTGFHVSEHAHESIRGAFDQTATYRTPDTFETETLYERNTVEGAAVDGSFHSVNRQTAAAGTTPILANFPTFMTIDFSMSRWRYFGVAATTLNSTSLGAIFRPVELWDDHR